MLARKVLLICLEAKAIESLMALIHRLVGHAIVFFCFIALEVSNAIFSIVTIRFWIHFRRWLSLLCVVVHSPYYSSKWRRTNNLSIALGEVFFVQSFLQEF